MSEWNSSRDDYDLATGPPPTRHGGRVASQRDLRMPGDLTRSRRSGLYIRACAECSMAMDQGFCAHGDGCSGPDAWVEWRTGPLAVDETSLDTGWQVR